MQSSIANSGGSTRPNRHSGRQIWLATLLFNLALAGLALFYVVDARRMAEDEARLITENYARVLEQSVAGFIKTIDVTLQNVVDELERQQARGRIDRREMDAFVARQDQRIAETYGLRISDSEGNIIHAVSHVAGKNGRISIADRPQFIQLRDHPQTGLNIGKPVLGRISQKHAIPISRRYKHPDGSFAGIVLVSLPVDYLIRRFSQLDLGRLGNSALWDRTTVYARYSRDDPSGASTGATTPSPGLRALLEADTPDAHYSAVSGIDGIRRLYHFRRIDTYPLYLIVGLAEADYLAEWRQQTLLLTGLLGLLVAGSLLFARHAHAGWRRDEAARRQLAELNEALEARTREAETARQHSEQILASAGEGICGVDAEGRVIFINPAARDMLGWRDGDGIGEPLHALIHHHHPDASPFPVEACPTHATIRDGQRRHVEDDWYWRRDGSGFPVEYTVAPLVSDGRVVGAVNVFRDVTEVRRNEALLRESEQHFRNLANSGAALIWTAGLDKGCNYFNEPWLRFTGRTLAQEQGNGWTEGVHPDDFQRCLDIYVGCFDRREAFRMEYRLRRHDGEYRWIRDDGTPRYDSQGNFIGYIGYCVDITEQKEAAAELERHRYHLESLVEERTAALSAAKEAAEAANVAKSAFLANMSHEIRTPLNAINGMVYLIRRDGVSPKQGDRLKAIETASGHLLEILNSVLELSKIEAGKLALERIPVDPHRLIDDVVLMLGPRAQAKQLALVAGAAPLPGGLLGDPTRLQQALLNYVGNAIKFTEQGSIEIDAAVESEDADSVLVRFTVADTGIGIAPEVLPKLFNAFEQADNSSTRRFGGTGLGLAITRKFARMMGGDAGVDSAPGQGSRFWFTARLGRAAATAQASAAGDCDAAGDLRREHAGARILLAEDEALNREIATSLLEDLELAVDTAEDGAEAVRLAGERDYDLILMDMQMPGLDGLAATRAIRARPGGERIPILAMTANAFAEDRARCLAAGMDDFIAKPVDPDMLFATLRRWLAGRAG